MSNPFQLMIEGDSEDVSAFCEAMSSGEAHVAGAKMLIDALIEAGAECEAHESGTVAVWSFRSDGSPNTAVEEAAFAFPQLTHRLSWTEDEWAAAGHATYIGGEKEDQFACDRLPLLLGGIRIGVPDMDEPINLTRDSVEDIKKALGIEV
jgi:hypothetical protein